MGMDRNCWPMRRWWLPQTQWILQSWSQSCLWSSTDNEVIPSWKHCFKANAMSLEIGLIEIVLSISIAVFGWMKFFFVEPTSIIWLETWPRLLSNKWHCARLFFLCQLPCCMDNVFLCGNHLNHSIWNPIKTAANSQRYCSVNWMDWLWFFEIWNITCRCSCESLQSVQFDSESTDRELESLLFRTPWIKILFPVCYFIHQCYFVHCCNPRVVIVFQFTRMCY